ncbi:putative baseplate wedge subunit protein [Dickeya phage vB_DsoM_AD1]|uniref:Putative baseplate wedge subunit protein n=1 Tax=Dickeya phage vB_DsoM_AD1 TaxID=2283029 RepID=A0A384ZY54_9CAUD|nr:putative baseplate wedge subunit protein [Dickeya phage vB_DsoM_AD1]AXG67156.1 putative baseplate wedge subunit protein [Dickeya phage vB_DsoM_AD1]
MSMLNTYTTHEEFAQDFLNRINSSSHWTDAQQSITFAMRAQ